MPMRAIDRSEAEGQDVGMLARRAGHREHVVEGHRHVGDDDLPGGLGEGLARNASGNGAVLIDVPTLESLLGRMLLGLMAGAQLAPHLPAHPQQQDAAGQEQAHDLEKLGRDQRENDTQDGGGENAEQDGLVALLLRETGGGQADDDGVVAGERQVDADDHQEGDDLGSEKLREIKHAVPHMSVGGSACETLKETHLAPACREILRTSSRNAGKTVFLNEPRPPWFSSSPTSPLRRGATRGARPGVQGPSRQDRARDQVTFHEAKLTVQ